MTKIDTLAHTWHIIFNENANGRKIGKILPELQELLDNKGIKYVFHKTSASGDGTRIAKQLCADGERFLVAAGGDGTVNEVVNGIFKSGVESSEVFLSVLPLGRGNDWVRTHNYPDGIEKLVNLWLSGSFVRHDIGVATSTLQDGTQHTRHFINIAGFGFDADVIYNVTNNKSRFLGSAVYVYSLLKALFTHKPYPVEITTEEGFSYQGNVFMIISAIGRYNGSGICEAKYAVYNDGLIDLIVIPEISIFRVIYHLKDMFTGDHIDKIKSVRKVLTKSLEITPVTPLRAEVEGELLAVGRYSLRIIPDALNVLSNVV